MSDGRSATEGALAGVLVVDFTRVLSGPLASMILGDLGADVVKVERPDGGDDTRAWGPPFADGESTYFLGLNRNKRSLRLDLKDEADRARAIELAERADILVENFRPGTMERLGLGYEELSQVNDRLIYCSISGFGPGDGAEIPGYDFLVQAVGGLMSVTGSGDSEPTKVGVALVDVIAGLFAAVGMLAALQARERTGRGQLVEVNLLATCLAALANQASSFLHTGSPPQRMGNAHPSIAPYESFAAEDRELVIAVGTDRQFAELCATIGMPDTAADPRYASNADRVQHRMELRELIGSALAQRPAADWATELRRRGVPCGVVNDVAEAFQLAETLGLRVVEAVKRDDGSSVPSVTSPIALSSTPVTYRKAPPRLGEHTKEILDWMGR